MPTCSDVITELLADPEACLRHYKIIIAGGSKSPSGVATFSFEDKGKDVKGFTTGLSGAMGKTKDRAVVRFDKLAGVAKDDSALSSNEVNAHYVAMVQVNQGASHYALPTNTGPNLMFTSQLTGCTFGVGNATHGCQLVSHVQPPSGVDNAQSQAQNFVRQGLTDGVQSVFGRDLMPDYTNNTMGTIVGVRTNGAWKFFAQLSSLGDDVGIIKIIKL